MSEMVLLGTSWKKFKMDDIFVFHKGKRLTKEDMTPGDTNFIAAIDDNNGIRQKIDLPPLHNGNCITVNYNGSIGESFYQDQPFRASDDVNILYPKNWELNKNIGLFLCTVIRHNKYRFGYGRKWNLEKMKDTNIALPVNKMGNPDWVFMNSYIEKLTNSEKIRTKIKHKELPFDTTKWKSFKLGNLFTFKPGKIVSTEVLSEGNDLFYCGAKKDDNGVIGKYAYDAKYISPGNCMVFICDGQGSIGYNNYMDKDFFATVNLVLGYNEHLNKYIGLFVTTVLDLERPKFSFGRKRKKTLSDTNVKLPADKNGNPDWDYMEKYIKSLPYSDLI